MNYCLLSIKRTNVTVQYTDSLIKHLIKLYGHKEVDEKEADAFLFSICDVTEIHDLVKASNIAKKYGKPLIAGGQFCYHFKTVLLIADIVNIGHIFDFMECKSIEEIKNLDCVYYPGKDKIITPSYRIDWSKIPIIHTNKKGYYYWGGTGCKNKCRFCYVSWTNAHIINPKARKLTSFRKGMTLTIISNEYSDKASEKNTCIRVKDMMLVDYLRKEEKVKNIRVGIEFFTEASRKYMGKQISEKEILSAIDKSKKDGNSLKFFFISGYNTKQEIIDFIKFLPDDTESKRKIRLVFNNLEYQMFTPLHKERKKMNPENYIDVNWVNEVYNKYILAKKYYIRTVPASNPAHAFCRMGMSWSFTKEQLDFWMDKDREVNRTPLRDLDYNKYYEYLWTSKVIENEYFANEIKMPWKVLND